MRHSSSAVVELLSGCTALQYHRQHPARHRRQVGAFAIFFGLYAPSFLAYACASGSASKLLLWSTLLPP
jgi:hypothetical protein